VAKGRGVVLEVRGGQAVVLDETGLFRRVPASGRAWRVGEEVWVDVDAVAPSEPADLRRGRPWWRTRGWAAAAACAALLAAGLPLARQAAVSAETVAIVTFDVNPSVQLDLNGGARVLRAVGLDADGTVLLRHVRVDGAPLASALSQLAGEAAAEGFVPKSETVPIVIAAAPARAASLPAAVTAAIRTEERDTAAAMVKAGYHVEVAAVSAASGDQRAAAAMGLSLGRYLIYRQARQAGVAVQPADLRRGPIVAALRHAGASEAVVQQVLAAIARRDLQGQGQPAQAGAGSGAGGASGAAGTGGQAQGEQEGDRGRGGRGPTATGTAGAGLPALTTPQARQGGDGSPAGAAPRERHRGQGGGDDRGGDGGQARPAGEGWPQRFLRDLRDFFRSRDGDRHESPGGDARGRLLTVTAAATATATATATASPGAGRGGENGRTADDGSQGH
jgi:hypothetical protein